MHADTAAGDIPAFCEAAVVALAVAKRNMERALRRAGWSKSEARAEVAIAFRCGDTDILAAALREKR